MPVLGGDDVFVAAHGLGISANQAFSNLFQ